MQGNMGNLFQQMQDNMRDMQEKLASLEVVGESGAGIAFRDIDIGGGKLYVRAH